MARMNLDFSNVQSRDPLPEGTYEVSVAKVEQKLSQKGNPMLKVEFKVMTDGFEKRKLWANYVLTEAAMWKVQELFKSLGLDFDGIVELDTDDMIGLTCSAKVTQREYEGNIVNDVAKTL